MLSTVCKGGTPARDDRSFFWENSLIMKGRPSVQTDDYVLVFNKMNKREVFKLDIDLKNHSCVSPDCYVPKFVDQMDGTLFAKIKGVVDFNFGNDGGKLGHLLLFNISGRPMMCFTFRDEDISREVRHKYCSSIE